jgi:hypothetical protein
MLASRQRRYEKVCQKRKRSDLVDDEAFHISSQYTNRAHAVVLRRAFDSEKKNLFVTNKSTLIKEISDLKTKLKVIKYQAKSSVNEYRDVKRQIMTKKQQLVKTSDLEYNWIKQCALITCGKLSSLVQANRLLQRSPEIYLLDNDRCEKCHIPFKFNNVICRYVCHNCSLLQKVLFVPEDSSVDTLILRAKTSGTDDRTEKQSVLITAKCLNGPMQRSKQILERTAQYKEFLLQYSEQAPIIPNEVLSLIFNQLSIVHLGGSSKCRLTAVKLILTKSEKFNYLVGQAARITRVFNGLCEPFLELDVIERLTKRFSHLLKLASKEDDKKKIFVSDVVTVMLLRIDGLTEESKKFQLHKTRSVLNESNKRYLELVELARLQDPELWPNDFDMSLL